MYDTYLRLGAWLKCNFAIRSFRQQDENQRLKIVTVLSFIVYPTILFAWECRVALKYHNKVR